MKLLHIGIFDKTEDQPSLRNALRGISSYYEEYNHSSHRNGVDRLIALRQQQRKFDVVFMQLQSATAVSVNMVKELHRSGVKVFNFTGDVRQPIPQWYHNLAPYVTTLFSNKTDSDLFKSLGFKSEYFQIGYNVEYYYPDGPKLPGPEIVFMGNNYKGQFPLSGLRSEMVDLLSERYGKRFGVFGSGWKNSRWLDQDSEAAYYRNCKIAINLSHFDLKRYSSDRLFRILGCGAFCLSHEFQEAKEEFTNGSELVFWSDLKELTDLIDYYLKPITDELRSAIAKDGNLLCQSKYTWKHRIETQLLPLIKS